MTYHVYAQPNGLPDISEVKLHPDMSPGYTYLGEFVEKPDLRGKHYVGGRWVSMDTWRDLRRKAYPSTGDQLDALWQAMDQGVLPKVEGFYDKIADVKKRFPKE